MKTNDLLERGEWNTDDVAAPTYLRVLVVLLLAGRVVPICTANESTDSAAGHR